MALVWESHWVKDYHEPRLVKHRGKWHWAVTKPKDLQKPRDLDKKLSTGTTDKVVAEERKQEVAMLNSSRSSSVISLSLSFANLSEKSISVEMRSLHFWTCDRREAHRLRNASPPTATDSSQVRVVAALSPTRRRGTRGCGDGGRARPSPQCRG